MTLLAVNFKRRRCNGTRIRDKPVGDNVTCIVTFSPTDAGMESGGGGGEGENGSLYAIFVRRKVCICGLAKILSSQITKKIGSANRKVSHLRKVRESNKLFRSASLRICDLRNLVEDRPPFRTHCRSGECTRAPPTTSTSTTGSLWRCYSSRTGDKDAPPHQI
jgi:hypothetical protein